MRCLGLVCILALASVFVPRDVTAAEGKGKDKPKDAPEQTIPDSAHVKVTLTQGKRKFVHPGFPIAQREAAVFEIDSGEQLHEITVAINDIDADVFRIHVDYAVDGDEPLSEDLVVWHGKQATLDKGDSKLVIDLAPLGKQDKPRKDEPDDSDDPLGGM